MTLKVLTEAVHVRFPGIFKVQYASHRADAARHRCVLWKLIPKTPTTEKSSDGGTVISSGPIKLV